MKGKLRVGFSFFVLLIVFSSCQKVAGDYWASNNPSPTPTPVANRIVAYVEETNIIGMMANDSFLLTYDNMNRLTRMRSAISGLGTVYNYNHSNGFSFEITTSATGYIRDRILVNSNGLVDTSWQYDDNADTTTFKWVYNANKQLIEERNYGYKALTGASLNERLVYNYNAQGNLNEIIEYDKTGIVLSRETYTYTMFNGNYFNPLISNFYPVMSTKLPATRTILTTGVVIPINLVYTYVFDSQNRLIKSTGTVAGFGSEVKKYYY